MINVTTKSLAAYLILAMNSWVPVSSHSALEPREETVARYESIAEDTAEVSLDPSEPPLFAGEHGRVQTALLLASIESFESNFKASVDDGRETGDHGTAFCLLQIRPALGIVLDGDDYGYWAFKPLDWKKENREARITGESLISDRKTCIRTGLHMARNSLKAAHHLGFYTGEGSKEGPKAKFRLNRAKDWFKSHPWLDVETTDSM